MNKMMTSARLVQNKDVASATATIQQALAQRDNRGLLILERRRRQSKRRAHAGNLMSRQGAGAQTAFVAPPVNLRQYLLLRPRPDI